MAKKAAAGKKATKKKSSSKKAATKKKSSRKKSTAKKASKKAPASRKPANKAAPASPPPSPVKGFPDLLAAQPDQTQMIARRLRGLVLDTLSDVVESVVANEKIALALYTRGEAKNVLCGIQPAGDACLLYVHNVEQQEGDRLELQGEGKNSRHVRFESLVDVAHDEVRNLLRRVSLHADS